jgi:hypothetical protein
MIEMVAATRLADFVLYPLSFLEASFCESFVPRTSDLASLLKQICGHKFQLITKTKKKAPALLRLFSW